MPLFLLGFGRGEKGEELRGKLMPKGRAKTEGPCGKMNKQTPLQGENYAVSQWHFPSSCAKFKSYGTTSSAEFGKIIVKAWKVRWNLHLYKWQGFWKKLCLFCLSLFFCYVTFPHYNYLVSFRERILCSGNRKMHIREVNMQAGYFMQLII